ncbi:MAG: FGGY-family carbohydrate kinase, partial [Ktedonobacterales bacterium]
VAGDGALQTLCHAVPGRWHVMRCILAGGSTLEWLAGLFGQAGEGDGAGEGEGAPDVSAVLARLLAGASQTAAGSGGVLFLPHLNGVRSPEMDDQIGGAFVGLRPETAGAELARAVIEGVALSLREGVEAARQLGMPLRRMRLAGGVNRYAPWPRVQAAAYGLPVERGETDDASALGAALLAADGVGALPLADSAARAVGRVDEAIIPDAMEIACYERLAVLHRRLYRQLRGTFHALARTRTVV